MRSAQRCGLACVLGLATACGGDDGGPPGPPGPPVPAQLAFIVQPSQAVAESSLAPAVQVELRTAAGARASGATNPVTLALGANPGSTALAGTKTVNAVNGVATFPGLSLDQRGRGYTLIASSASLPTATSTAFNIVLALMIDLLSAGGDHTCGIEGYGVTCWGRNQHGQLGDSTTTDRPLAVRVPFTVPGAAFARVSAGASHTCALTSTGALYCWGSNAFGQLGDGTQGTDRTSPVSVAGGHVFGWVSAGGNHTCGVIAGTGTVYCWGANDSGQLGDSSQTLRTSPVLVAGGFEFASVSAGRTHTCAVSMGTTYCWGANSSGQLGDGTTTLQTSPVPVADDPGLQEVYAGGAHTCGLTPAAVAYCWGENTYGQLGDNTTTQRTRPVRVTGGLGFGAISPGLEHTCGMSTTVVLHCWGRNSEGQLGDGSTSSRTQPQAVAGALYAQGVLAGQNHACGRTWDGPTYCWGSNSFGKLGDGSTANAQTPVRVVY